MDNIEKNKILRAQEKVREIKNFYWLVVIFCFVTLILFGVAYFLWKIDVPEFVVYIVMSTPLVFAVITISEYLRVFDRNPLFGKKWEERKLKEFMNEDKNSEQWK